MASALTARLPSRTAPADRVRVATATSGRSLRRGGLTLVETILSLFLISSVMVLMFNLLPSSMATIRRSDQGVRADELARSGLAQAQETPWAELTVGSTRSLGTQTANGITYSSSLRVLEIPGKDTNLIKGLRVTVTWQDRGQDRKVEHELWVSGVGR